MYEYTGIKEFRMTTSDRLRSGNVTAPETGVSVY